MKYLSDMENVLGILTNYKKRGIRISLDATGENLTIKGELSGLSDLDKVELRSSKELLISFLRSQKNVMLTRTALNMDERVALSPGQKGIWLHSHIEENDTMYLIPSVYDLVVPGLNEADLLSASEIFAGAHPILACVFGEKDGLPYQQLAEFTAANHLFFEDLSHFSASEQEAQSAEYIHRAMQQGFDLSKQAPWSITVMDLGENHYRFFVKIHHLIADGATLGLLVEGLVEAYDLQRKGLTYHYDGAHHHDFVGWISDKTHQQRSSDFWKSYLEHYPEDLQLSSMGRIEDSVSATAVEQSLPTFIRDRVAHFSSSHSLPLSQLFTFSFGLVLSKHGRQNDVIIGTPVEGRTQSDLQKMLGDLVNTVPVRLSLNYEKSALENLQIFGKGYLTVLEHQQYPFEYILDDIGYQRQADRFPLFNTMISFPNNQELGSKNENELKIAKEQALYDLTLSVIELTDSTELQLEFDRKKYTFEYASSILAQTLIVLDQVVSSAQTALSEISLLAESDRKAHLYKGLPKSVTNPSHSTVVEIITQMISKHPHALAVVEAETSYNFAALQLKSQAIAWTLEQHGLKSGDRVLVELPSGMDLLSSMLGIWQMGGVYVPIGTELPSKRKEEILEDSGAVITIDADFISGLSQTTDQRVELSREHLAYILYTSGSTGKPKGVAVSHGALLNKMLEEAALLKTTNLTTLTLTSPTFDVSLLELVLPLTVGGTVIVQQDKSNSSVFETILQNKVNVLQGTPTYFSHLETELDESTAQSLNETLELLCIGGESLNDALAKRLKRKLPNVRINNHYGPTEITIDALVKQNLSEFKQNSLGKPFGNTGAIIVDDYDNVLPENVQGELLITGPSLATAYWNNELETELKFPNVDKLGTRVYRTGDLAAWSKEGEIHFIGRKDKQIKYRGYRIELEEINARLREIDGISDAFTSVTSNVLVSWIITEGVDETLLREHLQQTLSEYMIPTVYEKVASIPMNANGKVDEKQLPRPRSLKAEYVAPRNELEEQLAEIWQEVLGVERVGIYDNFFELGGHSLKMLLMIRQLNQTLKKETSIMDVFNSLNIAQLSKLIDKKSEIIKLTEIDTNDLKFYPTTQAQKRIYFLDKTTGNGSYNMIMAFSIIGAIDILKIKKAFIELIELQKTLQTVFFFQDGQLFQKHIALSELPIFDSEQFDYQKKMNSFHIPFSFSEDEYLFRIAISKQNDGHYDIFFNIHHIICDGKSIEVLLHYFIFLLNHEKVQHPKLTYGHYAKWLENNHLETLKDKNYWMQKLQNTHFTDCIPVDFVRSKKRGRSKTISPRFDFDIKTLELFSKKYTVSISTISLSVLLVSLYKKYGVQETNIATDVLGRKNEETAEMIGMFVNNVILNNSIIKDETFSNLLLRVQETIIEAMEHENYPIDTLAKDLKINTQNSTNSMFQIMYNVIEEDDLNNFIKNQPYTISHLNYEKRESAKFDLSVALTYSQTNFLIGFEFDTSAFEVSTILELANEYAANYFRLISDPTIVIAQFCAKDKFENLRPNNLSIF